MSDMQRYIADDDWLVLIDGRPVTTPVPGEVVVVLASDAEAAIAAAREHAVAEHIALADKVFAEMLRKAEEKGQRDALAAAVQRVEALVTPCDGPCCDIGNALLNRAVAAIKGDSDE